MSNLINIVTINGGRWMSASEHACPLSLAVPQHANIGRITRDRGGFVSAKRTPGSRSGVRRR